MDRIKQMKQLKKKGLSYQSISQVFGISRQRVHQLISGYVSPSCIKKTGWKSKIWLLKLFDAIFERDNYVCQFCKKKGILIHHIDKDNKNNNPNNLICLCNKCHLKLHSPFKKGHKGF